MATIQLSALKASDIKDEPNLTVVTRLGSKFDLQRRHVGYPGRGAYYIAHNRTEWAPGHKVYAYIDDLRRDLATR